MSIQIQENPLENRKLIIITGASSGIGEATARMAAMHGYNVVLAARRLERILDLAREFETYGIEALPIQFDLSNAANIDNLLEAVISQFGKIDVLFNNAGFGRIDWLETLSPQNDIAQQIQVNLTGAIQLTRSVLPSMISRKAGHIIFMGSIASFIGTPTYTLYAATKFGLRGFSEALRREVSLWGIHVSTIYPGAVDTEFKEVAGIHRKTGIQTPSKFRYKPEQIAEQVLKIIKRPRRQVVLPPFMTYFIWMNQIAPGFLDWMMKRFFVARERR